MGKIHTLTTGQASLSRGPSIVVNPAGYNRPITSFPHIVSIPFTWHRNHCDPSMTHDRKKYWLSAGKDRSKKHDGYECRKVVATKYTYQQIMSSVTRCIFVLE